MDESRFVKELFIVSCICILISIISLPNKPNTEKEQLDIAKSLMLWSDYDKALPYIEESISLDSTNYEAFMYMGWS